MGGGGRRCVAPACLSISNTFFWSLPSLNETLPAIQSISLVMVTKPSLSEEEASRRTIKRRTHELQQVREFISGGRDAAHQQLASEVLQLSRVERKELVKEAGLVASDLPVEHGLAMKADLGLPWNKVRTLRR